MNKRISLALLAGLALSNTVSADEYVKGYTRSDGTYVHGHYRSSQNGYRYDNYSSSGNTNPYTGDKGYGRNEFTYPPEYNGSNRRSSSYDD